MDETDCSGQIKWLVETWLRSEDPDERERARKRIATLDDLRFLAPIRAFLAEPHDGRERDVVFLMLRSLLLKTGSNEAGEFLMELVGREKRATVKAELLETISYGRGRGVRIRDAGPALACLEAKMKKVRSNAIDALGSCGDPRAEEALIGILEGQLAGPTEGGWFLFGAARSLNEIATAKALPCALDLLEVVDRLPLDTRKAEIKAMALKIVCRVGSGRHSDLYVRLLGDGSPAVVKWHAMRALAAHAEAIHAPAIAGRVRTILAGQRAVPQAGGLAPPVTDILFFNTEGDEARKTELLFAFHALWRLSALGRSEFLGLFQRYREKLTDAERAYLRERGDFPELDDDDAANPDPA